MTEPGAQPVSSVPPRVIGLLPAAGLARRISPLPMSKELFPIGIDKVSHAGHGPKVVSQYLFERMAGAGINEAFVILRPGKWDIPAYFGDGTGVGMRLAYLTVHVSRGVPFTLDQAYPFVRGETIALGFPDILFWPENAYKLILSRLWGGKSDVVLGLFPTDEPENVGVVDVDEDGFVRGLHEKSRFSHLPYMWAIAVWRTRFTEFLHSFAEFEMRRRAPDTSAKRGSDNEEYVETPIGDVIQAAVTAGLRVEAEIFRDGRYIDIGTPENLLRAIRDQLP
jgi:glucose-1-phosphate thymidylyltransferase